MHTAAIDACMMEHAVSQATIDRMRALVGRLKSQRIRIGTVPRKYRRDLCVSCAAIGKCSAIGEVPE